MEVEKKIRKKLKNERYILKLEALKEVLSFLSHFPDEASEQDEALDLLLGNLRRQSPKSSTLDKETVHRVASLLLKPQASGAALRVIDDIFVIPKFRYDPVKKNFYEHSGSIPIHGDASSKAFLYRDRFLMLQRRLYRDPRFSSPAFDTERSQFGNCEISPIQSLTGLTGRRCVMGVISQLEDGHFYLEDLTAAVEINLSNALRFAEMEKCAENVMFVIISDIGLDNEDTMRRLKEVLCHYDKEDLVPSLFVFMGNFCSHPCDLSFNYFSSLRLKFGALGQMIGVCPQLMKHSRFLLIPGPDDPACCHNNTSKPSLSPPPSVQPVIWNYDHCLQLYPTPHMIVLGDKSEQKAFKSEELTCLNPGSFSNDSTFVAYRPCTHEVVLLEA